MALTASVVKYIVPLEGEGREGGDAAHVAVSPKILNHQDAKTPRQSVIRTARTHTRHPRESGGQGDRLDARFRGHDEMPR